MCGIHGESSSDPQAVMGILMNRGVNAIKSPHRFSQPDKGEFDQALRCPPDSKPIADLVRSLGKLKDCR
jgi:hypothetical protein